MVIPGLLSRLSLIIPGPLTLRAPVTVIGVAPYGALYKVTYTVQLSCITFAL